MYTNENLYVKEFQVPIIEERGLGGIATDEKGNPWFYYSTNSTSAVIEYDVSSAKFNRYNVTGETKVDSPIINLAAGQLVFSDNTTLWFTDPRTNSIGKISNGKIDLIPIPTEKSGPMGIAISPDHQQIWFAEILGNKIANLDIASLEITEYQLPEEDSGPILLMFDDKGVLWVTLSYARDLLQVEPWLLTSNAISGMTILSLPEPDSFSPFGISVVDDKLYLSDHASSRVIVSDTPLQNYTSYWTSEIQTFPTTLPGQVVADQKGNIFFPEHGGNRIAKIDSDTGLMTEYEIPTGPLSTALYASVANDGSKVWFVEWAANKIAYLDTTAALSFQLSQPLFAGKKVVVDQEPIILKQQTAVSLFASQDKVQGLSAIGMTEAGLEGITYSSQENGTITLRTENDAQPGKFTIMIRAANGPVAQLYPVNLILDVPAPLQTQLPNNQSLQSSSISIPDIIRWSALAAALSLTGYIIFNRIKRRKQPR